MRLAIGIPNNQEWIASRFFWNLVQDTIPSLPGGVEWRFFRGDGRNTPASRCYITADALAWGADAVLFLDSDQTFSPPDFIRRMLRTRIEGRLPMVLSGIVYKPAPPFTPLVWNMHEAICPPNEDFKQHGYLYPMPPVEAVKANVVFRAEAVSAGCLLVRAKVFGMIPKPWFKETWEDDPASPSGLRWTEGHDIRFCKLCAEAEIEVWVDPGIHVAHWRQAGVDYRTAAAYNCLENWDNPRKQIVWRQGANGLEAHCEDGVQEMVLWSRAAKRTEGEEDANS